ncbi:cell death-inducing p53-target protein 1 homolog [Clupea harengus]|uniref:Cell death-inducing p53-target protein 1 homolog n=1 Tax=Clupea harengus TaxID=7950 RepID=A0A6P8F748_CLUHA|nr:cell death-inducing p53-target protein 1 homolog [Clupea harengus]
MASPIEISGAPKPEGMASDVVITKGKLGSKSTITTCTNCRQRVETRVNYKSGSYSWCMCILLSSFGLLLGCCLIPFFAKSCKDTHHSCPKCNVELSVHKKCC